MRRSIALLIACAALHAQGTPTYENELAPVSFLVGKFYGKGSHPWGQYDETLTGEWRHNKTIIVVRSQSRIQGRVVFEDLRVFSYDPAKKIIRMRQYALGDLAVYEVAVEGDNTVLNETAHEGGTRAEWRYTYTKSGDGFSYAVHAKNKEGAFVPYVSGELRGPRDPSSLGIHTFGFFRANIPRAEGAAMLAEVHYPESDGKFPVIIFSPGGPANDTSGYGGFGRMFASWGYITIIVAFNDARAKDRAAKFVEVVTWLEGRNDAADFRLKGKLDLKKLVASGHSRGGHAAVLAARMDKRFAACLGLAPAGPGERAEGENDPPLCVIVGDKDNLIDTCRALYESAKPPRCLVVIEGMNHFFAPRDASRHVLARAIAFLNYRLRDEKEYGTYLTMETAGVKVEGG